jgi:hypothetical protein
MNATTHNTENYAGFAGLHDQNLVSEQEYALLRMGILPEYARKWVIKEFHGVPSRVRRQLVEIANEEPYHPQISISIIFGVISSYKSLEKWKKDNLRKSYQSISVSSKVNGKWVDLETTLWPPYEKPTTRSGQVNNTIYHRPARYLFKHGSIRVDLGTQDGRFSPILHNNPNSAMQSVATRLGRAIGGDFNRVAQQIVGNDDLIATSTSMRVGNQWIVLVTMMRDPKLTPASFHVTMEGKVKSTDAHHPANSVSEVEYALIKGIIEEEDSEQSSNYCYEFDGDHQAQMMIEAMSDNLDAETMTPTELLVMELAAENEDLIDFMSGASTFQSQDYHDLLDMRVEQTAMRLMHKYEGNVNKAFYVARLMHSDDYDALEDTQAYCVGLNVEKSFFTMKGSNVARCRFFGIPSTYPKMFMPAPNPFSQTKFLASTEYIAPVQKVSPPLAQTLTDPKPTKTITPMMVKANTAYINRDGVRGIAPQVPQRKFSLQDNPKLAAIVSAFALTGSLPKAIKTTKRKLSFA